MRKQIRSENLLDRLSDSNLNVPTNLQNQNKTKQTETEKFEQFKFQTCEM